MQRTKIDIVVDRPEWFSAMGLIHLYFQEAATKFPAMYLVIVSTQFVHQSSQICLFY